MEESETLSLRSRRKKAPMNISCCFNGHQRADSMDAASSSSPMHSPLSRALKGRCKDLMARVGRHRRHFSADLTYDPLSYSRNFQDNEPDHSDLDGFAARSFVSRLPDSPTCSNRYSYSAKAAMLMMTPTSSRGKERSWFKDETPTPTKKKGNGVSGGGSRSMDLLTPGGSYEEMPYSPTASSSCRVLVEM